jgi:hypothetical protein
MTQFHVFWNRKNIRVLWLSVLLHLRNQTLPIYNNSVQLFIYLRAELNSQGSITESARIQNNNNKKEAQGKNKYEIKLNELILFKYCYTYTHC